MRLSSNIFQIFLKEENEIHKVLFQGPWCFDNFLIITQRWSKGNGINSVSFDYAQFWIHVNGLPRECITKEMAIKVVGSFKEWEVVEIREELGNGGRFMRLRVGVNITIPLCQGIKLQDRSLPPKLNIGAVRDLKLASKGKGKEKWSRKAKSPIPNANWEIQEVKVGDKRRGDDSRC
ncbi:unnamed protein product [Ilex paraguariensis]|uniref:DUF4283 domain-containing protein n=1 Tax=Ilex paraguariensis TaxID=185542 RepID=A0ABC8TI40_9AQUA